MTRLHLKTRRRRILAGGVVALAALAIAGGAFAYFTSTGSTTATATGGTAGTVTLAASAPTGPALFPGGAADSYDVTVTAPSTGDVSVGQVSIVSVDEPAACTVSDAVFQSWFDLGSPTAAVGEVAKGDTVPAGSLSLALLESHTDQGCLEGQTLTVRLAVA